MEDISKKFSELVGLVYTLCKLCKSDDEYKKGDIDTTKELINELIPDIERYIARKEVKEAQAKALEVVNKAMNVYLFIHDNKYYLVSDKLMHEVSREDYYKCVGWIRNGN